MRSILCAFVFLCTLLTFDFALAQDVHVDGYYRSNGTYVQPHMRSAPDGNTNNNWSTQGNVNPYTGQAGTHRREPSPSYGGYGSQNNTLGSPSQPLGESNDSFGGSGSLFE